MRALPPWAKQLCRNTAANDRGAAGWNVVRVLSAPPADGIAPSGIGMVVANARIALLRRMPSPLTAIHDAGPKHVARIRSIKRCRDVRLCMQLSMSTPLCHTASAIMIARSSLSPPLWSGVGACPAVALAAWATRPCSEEKSARTSKHDVAASVEAARGGDDVRADAAFFPPPSPALDPPLSPPPPRSPLPLPADVAPIDDEGGPHGTPRRRPS